MIQLSGSNATSPGVQAVEPGREQPSVVARIVTAVRPVIIAAVVGAIVLLADAFGPQNDPWNPLVRYGLKISLLTAVATGVAAFVWCRRRGQTWDADLIAALWGAIGAFTILVSLKGTPYGPLGIFGDQSFRTANITRFADDWHLVDYSYLGKPAYYAPGFFWVLGRAASLSGTPAWQMLKVGLVAVAFLAPVMMYLLWRRHVPVRVAALIAGVALVAEDFYEPYGWIVFAMLVPWWIEVVHGPQRQSAAKRDVLVLGLIGAALFCVYYYYFFILPFFLVIHLIVARLTGRIDWGQIRRVAAILGVSAAGSAVFWLPLAWNFLTANEFNSQNNRWLMLDHGDLALPMFETSVKGLLCLAGLIYLLVTAGSRALSRSLLILLGALYLWHAAGFVLAAIDMPLMSFRMKHLVPLVLLTSAVIGLAELVKAAAQRFEARVVSRVAVGVAALLALFLSDRYATTISDHEWIRAAHNQTLPDGSLPRWHEPDAKPTKPAAEDLRRAIDSRFHEARHPIILSSRIDLYSYYPYYCFVQWNFSYSHPTAEFGNRVKFLESLADSTPSEFAARTADNPFDKIDAFVMYIEGEERSLAFYYTAQNYPNGATSAVVKFPRAVFDSTYFDVVEIDNVLVAVRK